MEVTVAGLFQDTAQGLAGLKVYLYSPTDSYLGVSRTTDADGKVVFDLPQKDYKVRVDYYGQKTPLNQVATISTPEARLVVIQPWDKGVLGEIEKAIQTSELSVNPNNDGVISSSLLRRAPMVRASSFQSRHAGFRLD